MMGTMDRRSDGGLAAAAVRGDERAFEVLVERHFNAVYLTAYARLGEREAAEDLAQEVFLRAYLHLGQLDDPERFSHWVCRVARNLAEDWRRHRQTVSRLLPMVPLEKGVEDLPVPHRENVRTSLERQQDEGAIRKAIEALPPEQREVVLLHYAEGLSDREIAQRLGMHYSTVYYHRKRALDLFREQIGSWLGSEAPALLPRRKAASRAAAIVAAAAAMNGESKTALAAASADGMPATSVATAKAGAPVTTSTSWFPALLETLKTSVFAGAGAMMNGKLAIAGGAVLALALTGGGAYYSATAPGGWGTPRFTVTPAKPGAQRNQNKLLGRFYIPDLPAREVIAGAVQIDETRVIENTPLPGGKWDVQLTGFRGKDEELRPLALPVIEKVFGISCHLEKRPVEALILKRAAGVPLGLKPPLEGDNIKVVESRVQADNAGLDLLAWRLQEVLKRPVVADEELTGRYSYDVRWHPRKLDLLNTHLRKQAGLELVPGTREMEVLVVDKGLGR